MIFGKSILLTNQLGVRRSQNLFGAGGGKGLRLRVVNFALGMDIMLFRRSLTVSRFVVGVPQSPG
jgi:hypothetical protein